MGKFPVAGNVNCAGEPVPDPCPPKFHETEVTGSELNGVVSRKTAGLGAQGLCAVKSGYCTTGTLVVWVISATQLLLPGTVNWALYVPCALNTWRGLRRGSGLLSICQRQCLTG